jgi:hypothetical protein
MPLACRGNALGRAGALFAADAPIAVRRSATPIASTIPARATWLIDQ